MLYIQLRLVNGHTRLDTGAPEPDLGIQLRPGEQLVQALRPVSALDEPRRSAAPAVLAPDGQEHGAGALQARRALLLLHKLALHRLQALLHVGRNVSFSIWS